MFKHRHFPRLPTTSTSDSEEDNPQGYQLTISRIMTLQEREELDRLVNEAIARERHTPITGQHVERWRRIQKINSIY